MLKFEEKAQSQDQADTTLTLELDQRIKSRLKVTLDDGREAGLFFAKGVSFKEGDKLLSNDGDGSVVVEIKAAPETLSTVYCDDTLLFSRACYHLGNRHVPLQIQAGALSYQHDHVLDEMVVGLGLAVKVEQAPFQPESGAYSSGGHSHSHGSSHDNNDHHKHD